jgi:ribosomal protein L3
VVGRKTAERDGYNSLIVGCSKVQINSEEMKQKYRLHIGLCRDAGLGFCLGHLREFRVSAAGSAIPVGTALNAAHLLPGQLIDVQSVS